MDEDLTTHYKVQYSGSTKLEFLFTKTPATGLERYIIACDILRDNPDILQVHWETPSQHTRGAGTGIQNRSENYRYS